MMACIAARCNSTLQQHTAPHTATAHCSSTPHHWNTHYYLPNFHNNLFSQALSLECRPYTHMHAYDMGLGFHSQVLGFSEIEQSFFQFF